MTLRTLAEGAWQEFESLPLERRYGLLLQYIHYVEQMVEEEEVPMVFLAWLLMQLSETDRLSEET